MSSAIYYIWISASWLYHMLKSGDVEFSGDAKIKV